MNQDEYEKMYRVENELWWYNGLRGFLTNQMEDLGSLSKEIEILDLGCGTGINLQLFEHYGQTVGMDYSTDALRFCQQRKLTRLTRGSALALPYADSSFDLVSCMDVLVHSSITSDEVAVREMFRILKPGGRVLLHMAALDCLRGQHDEVSMVSRRYTKTQVRELMLKCGFRINRLTYRNMVFFPVLLFHRQIGRFTRYVKGSAESDLKLPNRMLNSLMAKFAGFENIVSRKMNLPIGSSVYCLAEKPR